MNCSTIFFLEEIYRTNPELLFLSLYRKLETKDHAQSGMMLTQLTKFVAILMVGSFLVIPGSAVGSCLLDILAARHCGPHCPMMMGTQPGSQIVGQSLRTEGSCCHLSTSPPIAGKFTFTNQNSGRSHIDYPQLAVVAIIPHVVQQTAFPGTGPPRRRSAHRALLCILLI